MNKDEKIELINGYNLEGIKIEDKGNFTVPVLDLIIEAVESRKVINQLKEDVANAKGVIETEVAKLETMSEELTAVQNQVKVRDQIIEDLNASVGDKDKANDGAEAFIKEPIFTVGKKKLVLIVPKSTAVYNGKNVTVTKESLKSDAGLLKFCVEKGYGIFKNLEDYK